MLAVQSICLATALLFTVTAASAAPPEVLDEGANGSAPLTVASVERIRGHFASDPLKDVCRTDHRVYACTEPVTDGFHSRCEQFGDGWGIVVEVHVEFVIHLAGSQLLTHERFHIHDIETALPRVLAPLLAVRFGTAEGCAAVAAKLADPRYATAVLNQLATASNEARGCTRESEGREWKPKTRRDRAR
jgi:hypothetical protein